MTVGAGRGRCGADTGNNPVRTGIRIGCEDPLKRPENRFQLAGEWGR